MVLCGNVFILFSDDGPLRIETCTNVQCDFINISRISFYILWVNIVNRLRKVC